MYFIFSFMKNYHQLQGWNLNPVIYDNSGMADEIYE